MVLGIAGQHLRDALEKEEVQFETYDTSDLLLYVSESISGYDRVYHQDAEEIEPKRLKVKDFDFILPRLSGGLQYRTVILEHLNGNLGIYSPQKAEALRTASNKILTILKLSQAGIRVPKSVWSRAPVHIDHIINKMLDGLPVICKTVYGSQGAGVSILETEQTANTVLESFYKNDMNVKLQRYIDGAFKDIRAIVVGEEVVVAMERTANKGDFRANLSKQGTGKRIYLSDEDQKICVDAAKAVGLSFAGVDLMKDAEGTTFCIEANGNPGTKIISITGHNYFIDLVQYCKRKGAAVPKPKPETASVRNTPEATPATPGKASGKADPSDFLCEIDEELMAMKKQAGFFLPTFK